MNSSVFKKEYVAILDGILENDSGTIDAPIARKDDSIIERCINTSGQEAITHYEVLKRFSQYTFVKFILETGRTHQIRVHSKHIGHHILGDTLYGKASNLISRQALHAYKIEFIHPISKNIVSYIANIPEDINILI